jgi:hypothetical protein
MRTLLGLTIAAALAVPTVVQMRAAEAKSAKAAASSSDEGSTGMSKDDQDKLREHNKLRAEISKVKYPAPKSVVVAHVKGLKADDKKWFEQTLPDRTYNSADEVYSALGWPTSPEPASKK